MNIGFDAKRLFFNSSGLGNYSRDTVALLRRYEPQNHYTLFTPRREGRFSIEQPEEVTVESPRSSGRLCPSLWRSYALSGAIKRSGVELFHGLSNELPADIRMAHVKSVVTIHDLIFVRHPELYRPLDRWLYVRKYGRSAQLSDRIVAISRLTADDLINLWGIDHRKIEVIYQGCNPQFYMPVDAQWREQVRQKYNLPERYVLSVGTIEPRKNLMLTLRALVECGIDCDLVACGRATPYVEQVRDYATQHGFADRLHLFHDVRFDELPALYNMATVMSYPSFYEGFGIPILESLASGTAVITSTGGVFHETGGDSCIYVDSDSVGQMGDAINALLDNESLRTELIVSGRKHAERFLPQHIAFSLQSLYETLV